MFRAIGVGFARSLPSAAALNWVLKDGLGRLSRCIYTASLASGFDTNLKRVRFTTAVLFSLSIGVELLTPVFPRYFLVLASIANIAKQISLACYLATGSDVHRSFAIKDNLGEVSAKAQSVELTFELVRNTYCLNKVPQNCTNGTKLRHCHNRGVRVHSFDKQAFNSEKKFIFNLLQRYFTSFREGKAYRLKFPWVGVVNRSQADINKNVDMIAAWRREREYFATTSEYKHIANRMGSEHLAKMLSKHLETVIKSKIPGIQSLINKTVIEIEKS